MTARARIRIASHSTVHFTSMCNVDFFMKLTLSYIEKFGDCKPYIVEKSGSCADFDEKLEEVITILKQTYQPKNEQLTLF